MAWWYITCHILLDYLFFFFLLFILTLLKCWQINCSNAESFEIALSFSVLCCENIDGELLKKKSKKNCCFFFLDGCVWKCGNEWVLSSNGGRFVILAGGFLITREMKWGTEWKEEDDRRGRAHVGYGGCNGGEVELWEGWVEGEKRR